MRLAALALIVALAPAPMLNLPAICLPVNIVCVDVPNLPLPLVPEQPSVPQEPQVPVNPVAPGEPTGPETPQVPSEQPPGTPVEPQQPGPVATSVPRTPAPPTPSPAILTPRPSISPEPGGVNFPTFQERFDDEPVLYGSLVGVGIGIIAGGLALFAYLLGRRRREARLAREEADKILKSIQSR